MRIIQYLLPLMIMASAYGHQTTIKPIINDISIKKICKSAKNKNSTTDISHLNKEEYFFSIELYTTGQSIRSSQRTFPRSIELNMIIEGIPKTIMLPKHCSTFSTSNKQIMTSSLYKSSLNCSSLDKHDISMMLIRADFRIEGKTIPYILECDKGLINDIMSTA